MRDLNELKNITNNYSEISKTSLEQIHKMLNVKTISKGLFLKFNKPSKDEYFIFSGYGRLYVTTEEGIESTIAFLTPNSIAPPLKTRVSNAKSLVNFEAYTPLLIGTIESRNFFELCLKNSEVMILGNQIMEKCLIEKSEKEIALATLKGNERLTYLRNKYPGLENQVSHQHIASYLGITNVSLSRLRSKQKNSS